MVKLVYSFQSTAPRILNPEPGIQLNRTFRRGITSCCLSANQHSWRVLSYTDWLRQYSPQYTPPNSPFQLDARYHTKPIQLVVLGTSYKQLIDSLIFHSSWQTWGFIASWQTNLHFRAFLSKRSRDEQTRVPYELLKKLQTQTSCSFVAARPVNITDAMVRVKIRTRAPREGCTQVLGLLGFGKNFLMKGC